MLTQEHTTFINGKTVTHQHPITHVSGLFQGNHLNWAALTKEAYAIYIWQLRSYPSDWHMAVKKLSFCLADAIITL